MSFNNQQRQGAPKTMMDSPKLKLYGEKQNGSKSSPTFQIRLVNNFPRVVVVPNIGDAYDPINGPMDNVIFELYITLFDRVLRESGECRYDIELKGKPWDRQNNRRSDNIIVIGTLSVGRDAEGMIYTCFIVNNKPKCKFTFKLPFMTDIRKGNGEQIPDTMKSEIAANSWKKQISAGMNHLMATNYKHREPKQKNNGGGNYQNNNNNGYQGNNQNNNSGGNGGGSWGNSNDIYDGDITH